MTLTDTAIHSNKPTAKVKRKFLIDLDKKDPDYKLKLTIWVYFFLLIFEGALRKWVLPGLATPLLIIRDPVALYMIYLANQRKLIPATPYLFLMVATGIISIFTAVLFGHGSMPVALYGARVFVIHFPVIFIIGNVFTRKDVVQVGKVILWITIFMSVLITLQFYSPQSAFVNRGVGGDEGGGFNGAMGYFRPPGTFSFTNGVTLYYGLVAPFVFYFWLYSEDVKRWLLLAATAGLLLSVPLSLSRANFFSLVVALLFTLFAVSRKPAYLARISIAIVLILIVAAVLSQLPIFQHALEAFILRFNGANESEGGLHGVLVDRYLGGLLTIFSDYGEASFWGKGIGLGTNLGAQQFHLTALPEGEWAKTIWEQGLLLGFIVVLIRVFLSLSLMIKSYAKLATGDVLPWIMLSFLLLNLPQAQWKQPTSLGFSIIIGGLQIAALRRNKQVHIF